MKNKSLLGLGGFAYMALAMSSGNYPHSFDQSTVSDEEKIRRKAREEPSGYHKGLSEFNYGGGRVIYAINEKNADKKAKKKGWI